MHGNAKCFCKSLQALMISNAYKIGQKTLEVFTERHKNEN